MTEQAPAVYETSMTRGEIISFKEELRSTRYQGTVPLEAEIAVEVALGHERERDTLDRIQNKERSETPAEKSRRVMLEGIAIYRMLSAQVNVRSEYWDPRAWVPEIFVDALDRIKEQQVANG
jgi:hypothetical protein